MPNENPIQPENIDPMDNNAAQQFPSNTDDSNAIPFNPLDYSREIYNAHMPEDDGNYLSR